MIARQTTLVVGAGASRPYGLPSGHELREEICTHASRNGDFAKFMTEVGGASAADVNKFHHAFLRSQMYSIDAFLARRPEFTEIGKAAIAWVLLRREIPSNVFRPQPQPAREHWYQYLWNCLADSWDDFGLNRLRIITFNYDRSLEFFLLEAMKTSFGKSPDECREKLRGIPILHVYGSLGDCGPPGDPYSFENVRPYGVGDTGGIRYEDIERARQTLRVIPEQRDDDAIFATAQEYLNWAQVICFLGFGYDQLNLRRLGIARVATKDPQSGAPTHGRAILGTTLGLYAAERKYACESCGSHDTYFPAVACEELLRSFGLLGP